MRQRAAVVADEEDQRFFPHATVFERRHDLADGIIHALAHRESGIAVFVARVELRDLVLRCLQRRMHGIEGQISEKRPRLVLRDESRRLLAESIREVTGLLHHLRAAIDRIIRVIELEVIMCPATEKPEHLIKPAQSRTPRQIGPQMPFAKLPRRIARRLQILRKELLTHRHSAARLATRVEPQPLLIAPQHQPRSRRRAHMPGDISLPTNHALLRQRIEIRRHDLLRMLRMKRHIRIPEVIRDDEDDVGLLLGGVDGEGESE